MVVTADENNMRVDRFLERGFRAVLLPHPAHRPEGELRVNARATARTGSRRGRAFAFRRSSSIREGGGATLQAATKTLQALKDMILFEDADVMVLNKPAGLAVQRLNIAQCRHMLEDAHDKGGAAGAPAGRETSVAC